MATENKSTASAAPQEAAAVDAKGAMLAARAKQVRDAMIRSGGEEFAPLASDTPYLDFLKELLLALLPTLLGCFGGSAARAAHALRHPSPFMRARLFFHVRRELRDNETVEVFGRPLVSAILEVAKDVTPGELTALAA